MTLLQLRTYDALKSVDEMEKESFSQKREPISVRFLSRPVPIIGQEETCGEVRDMFKRDSEAPCIVYCRESGNPEGLIMREAFYSRMSGRFSREIYNQRPASYIADMNPMLMDISEPMSKLLQKALERSESRFYDCVLLTEHEKLIGVLTVKDLLQLSTILQQEAENKREYILGETQRHTHEIEGALSQVAEAAEITRMKCERIEEWSQTGRRSLEQVSTSYIGLVNGMEERASFVSELLKNAQKISSITRQIAELADHSGLLAINASIEAAHAGQHGKGFQIVAGEVQSLSKQTRSLSADISHLLVHIQHLVKETAEATDASLREIRDCESIVAEGGLMFVKMEQAALEALDAGSQVHAQADEAADLVKRVRQELSGLNINLSVDSNTSLESRNLVNCL
ncbi:methyl-accepting chemotaxis protein [Paenibacillus sp. GCM10028914]|uniref:methyl-accepting chemotaxis protein n=1 Tax=Paenibacillus sp. GCM10028914 TaxID=3273416 RepID=UPI003611B953